MKLFILTLALLSASFVGHAQLSVGMKAPEFSLPNMQDSSIALSSLTGKVILVDFWASWCGPCRAIIPMIKRLHNRYQQKGFEVIGVSLDNNKEQWLRAIKGMGMQYLQVIDADAWASKVAAQYFINEIPTSFLIDKEGNIVAINAEGAKLEKKIKALLKK